MPAQRTRPTPSAGSRFFASRVAPAPPMFRPRSGPMTLVSADSARWPASRRPCWRRPSSFETRAPRQPAGGPDARRRLVLGAVRGAVELPVRSPKPLAFFIRRLGRWAGSSSVRWPCTSCARSPARGRGGPGRRLPTCTASRRASSAPPGSRRGCTPASSRLAGAGATRSGGSTRSTSRSRSRASSSGLAGGWRAYPHRVSRREGPGCSRSAAGIVVPLVLRVRRPMGCCRSPGSSCLTWEPPP